MTNHPTDHSYFPGASLDPTAKAVRLQRFVGPARDEDTAQAEFWRHRSDAEHAQAGAELSDMAAQMAADTGDGPAPGEMFPGLSSFLRARTRSAG